VNTAHLQLPHDIHFCIHLDCDLQASLHNFTLSRQRTLVDVSWNHFWVSVCAFDRIVALADTGGSTSISILIDGGDYFNRNKTSVIQNNVKIEDPDPVARSLSLSSLITCTS